MQQGSPHVITVYYHVLQHKWLFDVDIICNYGGTQVVQLMIFYVNEQNKTKNGYCYKKFNKNKYFHINYLAFHFEFNFDIIKKYIIK